MYTRKTFGRLAIVAILVVMFSIVGCGNTTSFSTGTNSKEGAKLLFEKYYVTMPEMDLRANATTPGKVDTLYAGDEVTFVSQKDEWAEFTYIKDGEERKGCTWIGAIAPGIKIHLLDDEYIFRNPVEDRWMFGSIVMWREPSDPDLIILWQENEEWLYVLSTEDCRAGYMRSSANYEIVS